MGRRCEFFSLLDVQWSVLCTFDWLIRDYDRYIEGGDGWEFEDSFYAEQPRWLGEEATRRMRVNSEAVQKVSACNAYVRMRWTGKRVADYV